MSVERRSTRRSTAENRIVIEQDLEENSDMDVKTLIEMAADPKKELKGIKIKEINKNDESAAGIHEVDENKIDIIKKGGMVVVAGELDEDADFEGIKDQELIPDDDEEGAPDAKMAKLDEDEETNGSIEIQGKVKTKKEKVTFPCPECERKFLKKSFLTKHIKSHSAVRPFVCDQDQCDRSFIQMKALLKHVKTVHQGLESDCLHLCPFCQKAFITRAEMENHAEAHVHEYKMYACRFCGKTFSKKFTMRISVQASQDQIPDPCPYCNKVINSKAYSDK